MFKNAVFSLACLGMLLTGCATAPSQTASSQETPVIDPWEKVNRPIFAFNERLDAWIAKPLAKGYVAIAPSFVETGVGNFFDNVAEVPSALNNVLQAKWLHAGYNTGRFLVNTVAGLGGVLDVASKVGFPQQQREDFGQTLRSWGVPQGPYIMLPLLGPSTITDVGGRVVDWGTTPTSYIERDTLMYGVTALDFTHARASLLDVEALVSGDKYVFFRESYLQNRLFLLNDGVVEDDFGGDLDDFDDF